MNPMNTHTQKRKERALHMRVLWTIAALCLLQLIVANVSFAQGPAYSPFSYPGAATGEPQGPTGVRGAGGEDVYVTGIWNSGSSQGLLYFGPLTGGGNSGTWTVLNYPGAGNTSLYGPNGLPSGNVRLVGSYTTSSPTPPHSTTVSCTKDRLMDQATGRRSIIRILPGSRSKTRSPIAQWGDLSSATLIRTLTQAALSFTT
jgi:hypothetical protein